MSGTHSMHKSTQRPEAETQLRTLERLETAWRASGRRLTRQRRSVLRALLAAGGALTAYELLERLRMADRRTTPAGVYRALEFWITVGVVHRLESTRSFILCEHPEAPHPGQLLICRECGQVVETEDKGVVTAANRLGERLGFVFDRRLVEFTGVCGPCRARGRAAEPGRRPAT
jgi:Fur family zinc uptake transcriptional regulator